MATLDPATLTDPEAVEAWSVLHGAGAAVLAAGAPRPSPAGLVALRRLPTVTVLVGSPADADAAVVAAVDVCVTGEPDPPRPWVAAEPDGVLAAVASQPEAALTFAALLRTAGRGDVWAGLVAESSAYAMLLGSRPFLTWLDERGPARPRPLERPPVAVDRHGDVLRLVLDRPEARNAFDSRLRDALVEGLRLAAAEPSLRVELRGRGPCFSAGGDLKEFGTVADPATAHAVRLTRHPGAALAAVAGRVTAYLHGPCAGAGIEVPALAAAVVADPGATFRLPELAFGLLPGAGGTVSIPRRIGRQRAAWLGLTGHELDAATALAWGLVDRLEPVRG